MQNIIDNTLIPLLLSLHPFDPQWRCKWRLVCKHWRNVIDSPRYARLMGRVWPEYTSVNDHPGLGTKDDPAYVWQKKVHDTLREIQWWHRPQFVLLRARKRRGKTHVLLQFARRLVAMGEYVFIHTISKRHDSMVREQMQPLNGAHFSTIASGAEPGAQMHLAMFWLYDDIDLVDPSAANHVSARLQAGYHAIATAAVPYHIDGLYSQGFQALLPHAIVIDCEA